MGYDLEEDLSSVCHERDASIVTALRPVLLLVQNNNRGIFPLMRYTSTPPYGDHNGVELLQDMAVTITIFILEGDFKQSGRKLIESNSLRV